MLAVVTAYTIVVVVMIVRELLTTGLESRYDWREWLVILVIGMLWPATLTYRFFISLKPSEGESGHRQPLQTYPSLQEEEAYWEHHFQSQPYTPMRWQDTLDPQMLTLAETSRWRADLPAVAGLPEGVNQHFVQFKHRL